MIRRLIALVLFAWVAGFALFMLSLGQPLDDRKTDAIVVPTGAPGRIDRGIAVLSKGAARRMLVTGTDPQVTRREFAVEYRVPDRLMRCCIELEHVAVDTRSNASETAEWVHRRRYKSVRLVTSDWHMPRAKLELRNALNEDVELVGDPVPSRPRFGLLVEEYNKYLVRRFAMLIGVGG